MNGLKICHTFTYLVPLAKYYREHPEYYALVDGVRRDVSWQLCLTNPDVLRIATEKVLELLAADPTAKMVGVSHNDNQRNYCRCERCAAVDAEEESHAGTELRFVNAIADEVKKRHPGVLVQTLAYQYTRKPPKLTRPRDNVVITLCSIECDRLRPFGSPKSADVNKAFVEDLLGAQLGYYLLFIIGNDILRDKSPFDIYAELLFLQVPDVPFTCLYRKTGAQKLLNCPGFGRRFDDY